MRTDFPSISISSTTRRWCWGGRPRKARSTAGRTLLWNRMRIWTLPRSSRYAIQNIGGKYEAAELPDLGENETIQDAIPADPNVKNYSYAVVDGEVYYRENSVMVKPNLNATAKERVKGMAELRDCVHRLIDLQMWESDDISIAPSSRSSTASMTASPRNTASSTAAATPSPLQTTAPIICSAPLRFWTMRQDQAQNARRICSPSAPSSSSAAWIRGYRRRSARPVHLGKSLCGYALYGPAHRQKSEDI